MRISDWSSDVCSSDLGACGCCGGARSKSLPGSANRGCHFERGEKSRRIPRPGFRAALEMSAPRKPIQEAMMSASPKPTRFAAFAAALLFSTSAFAAPPPGLDARVEAAMQAYGTPGFAVAIVEDGEVVHAKGYGVRKLGSPGKVDADTIRTEKHTSELQSLMRISYAVFC